MCTPFWGHIEKQEMEIKRKWKPETETENRNGNATLQCVMHMKGKQADIQLSI